MNDAFDHAKANANPDCPKCLGTGRYCYTTRGTPHFTICDLCCRHDRGWWQLSMEGYGKDGGKFCCRAGCGKVVESLPK